MKPTGLPAMEGWTPLPEAAEQLGMSRQRAHQLLRQSHGEDADDGHGKLLYFVTARQLGTIIAVRTAEVEFLVEARKRRPEEEGSKNAA